MINYFKLLNNFKEYESNNKNIYLEVIDNETYIISLYINNSLKDECIFYKEYNNEDFILMINDYIEEFIKS